MAEREHKIIIADDQEVIRESFRRMLQAFGLEVVATAGSVAQVIELVDSEGFEFTFAVIDGNMPNKGDGEQAASYIKEKRPDVIVMSLSAKLQEWGDLRMSKSDDSPQEIVEAIRKA